MNNSPLRVAVVDYLNAVPLFWGLQHGPHKRLFDLQFMLPSKCADALCAGEVDGAILPSIEYQRIEGLRIVPGLCVASPGPVRSVLLISKKPIEQIRSVALDTSSRTSVSLVQIILCRQYKIHPDVKPAAPKIVAMLHDCDAAVMIGDPALESDFPGLNVYDLADEWRNMTGLPFVFAIWALREEAAATELVKPMQESTAYALRHLNELAEAETRRTGLPLSLIHSYLTENIDFNLGEKNLQGLLRFYELAHECSLTNGNKPLSFV